MSVTICNGRHDVEGYDYNSSSNSEAAWAAHVAACHETAWVGKVLRIRETNTGIDDDEYALVWDEEQQQPREVFVSTTRGWTYHNGAGIDATREVIEKAIAWETERRFTEAQRRHAETPRMGYTARATVKGATVEGVIAWVGKDRNRYADIARYGIKVEGRKGYVFRSSTDADFQFDVPPVSAEDLAEWRATCEHNARAEFRQALALADKREPLPGPGTVVDSQEADADGWRLYAIGEAMIEDATARRIAAAVLDESATDYRITGARRDGSEIEAREVTLYQALHRVSMWADSEGARIEHDGAGAVRLVREDGARLVLRPVRPQEAQGAPVVGEEAQEVTEAADAAQGAAQGAQGAQGARLVQRVERERQERPAAEGERGCVRRTVLHLYSDGTRVRFVLDAYSDGERLARVTRFAADHVQGVSLPTRRRAVWWAEERPQVAEEGAQGTEGDPAWVERRDVAWRALGDVMDGGAGRYRRTVLGVDGAYGVTDTMPTAAARAYLAEELADGGGLEKPGMGVRLVLVRANGARVEMRPERGAQGHGA